jgi:hypothetical protein
MIRTPRTNRPEKKEKVYRVPALERALDILDLIRSSGLGRTASELSSLLRLPYSTTFYLIKTMEQRGFVRRDDETKKFYLGAKLMSFQGGMEPTDIQIRDASSPSLGRIAAHFHLTAHTACGTERKRSTSTGGSRRVHQNEHLDRAEGAAALHGGGN